MLIEKSPFFEKNPINNQKRKQILKFQLTVGFIQINWELLSYFI
jgi:hypothetical protein